MSESPRDRERNRTETLTIRAPRGRVSGLRRNHVRAAIVLLVGVVALALIIGLGIDLRPDPAWREREIDVPREAQPSALAGLPGSYADLPPPPPETPPQAPPSTGAVAEDNDRARLAALRRQNEALQRNLAAMMTAIEGIDAENKKLLDQIARYQSEAMKEQAGAWASALFIKIDSPDRDAPAPVEPASTSGDPLGTTGPLEWPTDAAAAADERRAPMTSQDRKLAFLNQSVAPEAHLDQPYLFPRSPYEIQAGSIIPAALLTGINTDLPGDVVAVVTAPVYDSRTGQFLLIPQGAKLYGAYDSEIGNGQNRALLVWHRLLMPNGRSITLDRMRGTDAAGYAGVADRVDYHLKKLAAGAALSSVIAYAGNLARGRSSGGDDDTRDVIGDTVAQEASRIGSKIIDRQLDVQPTITVRPGWPVRVLVNKDILLEPYED